MAGYSIRAWIEIEGIGTDTSEERATRWLYKVWRGMPNDAPSHLVERALSQLPRNVGVEIDPQGGEYATTAFNFQMPATEAVITALLTQATRALVDLDQDIDSSATTIPITLSDQPTGDLLNGQVLYIGRETVRLGTYVHGTGYTGCDRGWWSSDPESYSAGVPTFLTVPRMKDRRIMLYVTNPNTHDAELRWVGLITQIRTDDMLSNVTIESREFLSVLARLRIGSSPELRGSTQIWENLGGRRADGTYSHLYRAEIDAQSSLFKTSLITAEGARTMLQVGDVLLEATAYDNGLIRARSQEDLSVKYLSRKSEGEAPDEPTGWIAAAEPSSVREVFVVSKRLDEELGRMVSATQHLPRPYNAVAIAHALLVSSQTYTAHSLQTSTQYEAVKGVSQASIFSGGWAIGALRFIDRASWREASWECDAELDVEQLFISWDGKLGEVFDIIQNKLLRPRGFFLTITERGLLGVGKHRVMTVEDYCSAQENGVEIISPANGGKFSIQLALASAVDRLVAKVGELPWRKPSSIEINLAGDGIDFSDGESVTFDFSTISAQTVDGFADADAGDAIVLSLIDEAIAFQLASPRLTISVKDSALTGVSPFDVGKWITLSGGLPEDARLPAPDENGVMRLVTLPTSDDRVNVQFTGMIIGRQYNIANGQYDLTLLLSSWRTGYISRLRAPSAVIKGFDSGAQVLTTTISIFDRDESDHYFLEGDEIEIWERHGAKWVNSVVRSITNVTGSDLTIDGWYASDPDTTMIIRLASSDNYSNAELVECFERPYVFLADTSDEIDTPGGGIDPADVYA